MCVKLPYCNPFFDKCLIEVIKNLKLSGIKTLASCCGHGKYRPTIIVKDKDGNVSDLISGVSLKVKKRNRYYKKDNEGYYFIPEIINLKI